MNARYVSKDILAPVWSSIFQHELMCLSFQRQFIQCCVRTLQKKKDAPCARAGYLQATRVRIGPVRGNALRWLTLIWDTHYPDEKLHIAEFLTSDLGRFSGHLEMAGNLHNKVSLRSQTSSLRKKYSRTYAWTLLFDGVGQHILMKQCWSTHFNMGVGGRAGKKANGFIIP